MILFCLQILKNPGHYLNTSVTCCDYFTPSFDAGLFSHLLHLMPIQRVSMNPPTSGWKLWSWSRKIFHTPSSDFDLLTTTPLDPVNCQRIEAKRDERYAHQSCFGRLIEQPRNKYKNVFVNNFDFLDEHWTVEKFNVLPVYWSPTKNQGVCLFLKPIFI